MITKQEIAEAQKSWANGIINIGQSKDRGDQYHLVAKEFIQQHYTFESSTGCLFKPTKAREIPFRHSLKAALSYFVGRDEDYAEDKGFALEPWTEVEFKNSGYLLFEKTAVVMGQYQFTSRSGDTVNVEYTFGYERSDLGALKINLHHSSVPYSA